ncbi:hypothetical protein GCM10027187_36390 [Streptosporangium sandarakinum]
MFRAGIRGDTPDASHIARPPDQPGRDLGPLFTGPASSITRRSSAGPDSRGNGLVWKEADHPARGGSEEVAGRLLSNIG